MRKLILPAVISIILTSFSTTNFAADLNISNTPLFISQSAPPLTLLVMSRDHKLYFEAYNDASDLNGDGTLDLHYKPTMTYPNSTTVMDYYGYFDSHKCYNYNSGGQYFEPAGSTGTNKTCSGNWSGDFLNYLTTSRLDAIRKVLYGGYRSVDNDGLTILERTHVTQDAHSWGKQYPSVSGGETFNISDYTPFGNPTSGNKILFANTTVRNTAVGSDDNGPPLLRVLQNQTIDVANWVSIERPVAGDHILHGTDGPNISSSIQDFVVRVKVCDSTGGDESNCKEYPNGNKKPTGLLHTFGENDTMYFGLLTGSYSKNLSGGVLRKNISSFSDEVDEDSGKFTAVNGIVKTIDKLKILGFSTDYAHDSNCGFITTRSIIEGECTAWGNPVAEMLYEGLRYFAGRSGGSSQFLYSGGDDATLGLPLATWEDPYDSNPYCAQPNILLISDLYPSYDSDTLPGVNGNFGSSAGDTIGGLNVSSLASKIWSTEIGGSANIFIGQNGNDYDGSPSPKSASSFATLRGLAPEEPNKQGSYYSASVAYHGHQNDISNAENDQKVSTYVIALASPLPNIRIPVNGSVVTLVPFAKSAGACNNTLTPDPTEGQFQPTNTLVDFYVSSLGTNSGTFSVNFEDREQGADFDMDSLVTYSYSVDTDANTVTINVATQYSAGCTQQHIGYVISGTTEDGTYLVVRDDEHTSDGNTDPYIPYFLDLPDSLSTSQRGLGTPALDQTSSRTFSVGSTSATFLQSPLWYAAKWGGFTSRNGNDVPDLQSEWDANADGVPDKFFLVTNPANLLQQLTIALDKILGNSSSSAAASLDSSSLSDDATLYQATFNSQDWSGRLLAFKINSLGQVQTDGTATDGAQWDASTQLQSRSPNSREIITYNPVNNKGVAFAWNKLGNVQKDALNKDPDNAPASDGNGQERLAYLRGDTSQELQNGGSLQFRNRSEKLGDIINSSPFYVHNPFFHHPGHFNGTNGVETESYAEFVASNKDRTAMVYVGANDGMLHGFDAETGEEKIAFIPNGVYENLSLLTSLNYTHKYYVDGSVNISDVFYSGTWHTVLVGGLNKGGKSVYALDITDPASFTEGNANSIFLWEYTDDDELGFTFSKPAIVRLKNNKWAALFGNGYNSGGSGDAKLYIVDIETGDLIKKINTGIGKAEDPNDDSRPNALATPAGYSENFNGILSHVYAGDLFGNLWRFDLDSASSADWDVSNRSDSKGIPIFQARNDEGNAQPITVRPTIGKLSLRQNMMAIPGKVQIYFGTGKYLEPTDHDDVNVQTFYAIEDDPSETNTASLTRDNLLEQTIISEVSISGREYRITSKNNKGLNDKGWYLDLIYQGNAEGERVVSHPILRDQKIIFTTLIPTNSICDSSGTGWLMELDAISGARLSFSPFDTNQDGSFNNSDLSDNKAVSGLKSSVGIIPTPGILNMQDGQEMKFMPGSSGSIETVSEQADPGEIKRQSWEQLR